MKAREIATAMLIVYHMYYFKTEPFRDMFSGIVLGVVVYALWVKKETDETSKRKGQG